MMRRVPPAIHAGILAMLVAPAARAQEPRVSGLEIRGSSDPTLVRYLTVKVGQPADPEAIRSSVLLLSAMDLFDEVSVEREVEADGSLRLVFDVQETPRVGALRFVTPSEGGGPDRPVDSALAGDLARASGLRPGALFREKTLADASTRMVEWLRTHAYPRARVDLEVVPVPAGAPEPSDRFARDLRVVVHDARPEVLVSSRVEGWPTTLVAPKPPGRRGEALTDETVAAWKEQLLSLLFKASYYRAQARTESVQGDIVFFVTSGLPFEMRLDLLTPKEKERARARFEKEGLSQEALEETMSAIESDYIARGHRDVEVDFQEVPQGDHATGEFVVRPGPAWTLASVEYQTDGQPAPRAGGLLPGRPWIDAEISAEKTRLLEALFQQGYAGALVSHEETGEPANARAIFKILPGSLSLVESVRIEGAPPQGARSRGAAVELRTRETTAFRNADVARDRAALLASLRDDGYVDARVEVDTDFSDDRRLVAVVFRVMPGPRVKVGRILVAGLRVTRESVILQESRLKEGDYLSYQKLLDTQAGLSATGLFTDVQIRELSGEADERNLIVEVAEGPRTTIVPGLGFAETEKLRASIELTQLNIAGRARTASLFLRGSIKGSSRALLSLTEPYAFGRRQAVNVQIYWDDDRSRDAFDFHRLGFETQTLFPVRGGNLLARYTFRKTTTSNVETDCAEINRDLCDGKVSGPSLGFVHDTRNDALEPRRGTLFSLETLVSTTALGGDSFVKGSAFLSRYEEVRAGTVLAGSLRVGLSRAFGSSVELPLPERFFAGGAALMRGFRTDEVGPGLLNAAGAFVPSGGNALLAAALEARIDVTKSWGVQVFAETGNVYARVNRVRLRDLREVAGLGLTYRSPFGPLRLDWGFKLDRRDGESRQQLHVGVGYAF